jgi:signal transduction histidine kinase
VSQDGSHDDPLSVSHDGVAAPSTSSGGSTDIVPPADAHHGPDCRRLLRQAAIILAGGVGFGLACSALPALLELRGIAGLVPIGVGAAGVATGAAVAWRRVGATVRTLIGVGEALEGYRGGELSGDAMRFGESATRFAEGWNQLIDDRAEAREAWFSSSVERRSGGGGAGAGGALVGALDALWQGLLLVDDEMRVLHANGAAGVMLGVGRESVGRALPEFGVPDELVEVTRTVVAGKKARESGEITRGEGPERSVLRVSARRVRRDDRGEAIVFVEDITQQRVAEEARHALIGQTAHELRSPLTTIRLHAEEAIDADGTDVEFQQQSLNVINGEARRLERVVSDLLSVSEMEAGSFSLRMDDVRLDAMFNDLRSDYQAQAAAKPVELVFDLPPKWPVAKADRDKLGVCLHNLVGNAIKYTPADGTVTVRVNATDTTLTVEVEDTGIGIRPEERDRVFEKFFRSGDGRVGHITGSGIGLATAREIARMHGGDITLVSELDRGSTFTLNVPISGSVASLGADSTHPSESGVKEDASDRTPTDRATDVPRPDETRGPVAA